MLLCQTELLTQLYSRIALSTTSLRILIETSDAMNRWDTLSLGDEELQTGLVASRCIRRQVHKFHEETSPSLFYCC